MFELKPISKESIPRALSKAERYRLLNEPRESESICRDILAVDPANQEALVCLILALTDLFSGVQSKVDDARPLVSKLKNDYQRAYYAGVVEERWGKSLLSAGYNAEVVFGLIRAAMQCFEQAQTLAPVGNDDATLRWNACVRIIQHHRLAPAPVADDGDEFLEDDVPVR